MGVRYDNFENIVAPGDIANNADHIENYAVAATGSGRGYQGKGFNILKYGFGIFSFGELFHL